ncbi:hypothetical protein IWZ01DRAFT_485303 [Phyllosticta capitalensis]
MPPPRWQCAPPTDAMRFPLTTVTNDTSRDSYVSSGLADTRQGRSPSPHLCAPSPPTNRTERTAQPWAAAPPRPPPRRHGRDNGSRYIHFAEAAEGQAVPAFTSPVRSTRRGRAGGGKMDSQQYWHRAAETLSAKNALTRARPHVELDPRLAKGGRAALGHVVGRGVHEAARYKVESGAICTLGALVCRPHSTSVHLSASLSSF